MIKKTAKFLLILILSSCNFASYEKWDKDPSIEVANSQWGNYVILDKTHAKSTDGLKVDVREYEEGKVSAKKGGNNGINYVDAVDYIIIESKAPMKIKISDNIPDDDRLGLYDIDGDNYLKLNVYDIVTKCGYDDFGDVIAVITFGENETSVSYDVVI